MSANSCETRILQDDRMKDKPFWTNWLVAGQVFMPCSVHVMPAKPKLPLLYCSMSIGKLFSMSFTTSSTGKLASNWHSTLTQAPREQELQCSMKKGLLTPLTPTTPCTTAALSIHSCHNTRNCKRRKVKEVNATNATKQCSSNWHSTACYGCNHSIQRAAR